MASLLARFREPLMAQLAGDQPVRRLLEVEALLYRSDAPGAPVGRLCESRWSDGHGSLTLNLDEVPEGHDGTARLYSDGMLVAGFDFAGRRLAFRWLGMLSEDIPVFDPGQQVRLEVAGMAVIGTVTKH